MVNANRLQEFSREGNDILLDLAYTLDLERRNTIPGPLYIKVYNYRHDAQRAIEILKSHRIWAMIRADDAGGIKLIVISEDEEKAREILDSFDEGQSD